MSVAFVFADTVSAQGMVTVGIEPYPVPPAKKVICSPPLAPFAQNDTFVAPAGIAYPGWYPQLFAGLCQTTPAQPCVVAPTGYAIGVHGASGV